MTQNSKTPVNVELLNDVFIYMFDYADPKQARQTTTVLVIYIEHTNQFYLNFNTDIHRCFEQRAVHFTIW